MSESVSYISPLLILLITIHGIQGWDFDSVRTVGRSNVLFTVGGCDMRMLRHTPTDSVDQDADMRSENDSSIPGYRL